MGQLFDRMVINQEFMEQISDRGLLVWANSGFPEFVIALKPYGKVYPEIALVTSFFESNLVWFRRIYQFLRAELIMQLREEGPQDIILSPKLYIVGSSNQIYAYYVGRPATRTFLSTLT